MRIILLSFLLASNSLFAQSYGETKILVKVKDTQNLFNRIVSYLYENGYTLETKDEAFHFISTNEKAIKPDVKDQMKARILIKEDILTITGEIYDYEEGSSKVFQPAYYQGKWPFNYHRQVWQQLEVIGKNFGDITNYEIEARKQRKKVSERNILFSVFSVATATLLGYLVMNGANPY
jgi:hypothetical protein